MIYKIILFPLILYLQFKTENQENALKREYLNGTLLIQRLETNLVELQNCYDSMQNVDQDKKYEKQIIFLKKEVNRQICAFTSANQSLDDNHKFKANLSDSQFETNNSDIQQQPTINFGLQIQEDMAKLTESRERLRKVESLNEDIQELNTLAGNLAALVGEQQETVNTIEDNVAIVANDVEEGTKSLIKV